MRSFTKNCNCLQLQKGVEVLWEWYIFKYVLPRITEAIKANIQFNKKGRQFIWGKEQQNGFEEIKHRLKKPPILHMPNHIGRFHL